MTSENPEGWENHQLQKSLRRMAEDADVPDEVDRIILPNVEAAEVFAPLVDEDITMLAERFRNGESKLVVLGRGGGVRTTIPDGTTPDEATLDLRIGR